MNDRIRDPNSMVWMSVFGRVATEAIVTAAEFTLSTQSGRPRASASG